MKDNSEICRLETLLTTAGEELVRLGSSADALLAEIESREKKWLPSYSIGGYNQMRMYIHELEQIVGPDARKLRDNRQKYLTDWFKETEPK
jgi:hypothetical protein